MDVSVPERVSIRRARPEDEDAVTAFTDRIWTDRGGDYLGRVYRDWLEEPGSERKHTFLAEIPSGGDLADRAPVPEDEIGTDEEGESTTVAGLVQAVMLSDDEAWFQGMRVNPDYQGMGISRRLNEACVEWARDRGATVGRIMTFSWNAPALGAARAAGFDPVTEFRWAHPDPDAAAEPAHAVSRDPAAAWRCWSDHDARDHLRGLGLCTEESWALRALTRADLDRLSRRGDLHVLHEDGVRGFAYNTRLWDRTDEDGETTTYAEYGVGVWADVDTARSLFDAIAADAAERGADETRVLIPETVRYVSDASAAGARISEEPDFVLGIDLTR